MKSGQEDFFLLIQTLPTFWGRTDLDVDSFFDFCMDFQVPRSQSSQISRRHRGPFHKVCAIVIIVVSPRWAWYQSNISLGASAAPDPLLFLGGFQPPTSVSKRFNLFRDESACAGSHSSIESRMSEQEKTLTYVYMQRTLSAEIFKSVREQLLHNWADWSLDLPLLNFFLD